jgi:hypothetical protein
LPSSFQDTNSENDRVEDNSDQSEEERFFESEEEYSEDTDMDAEELEEYAALFLQQILISLFHTSRMKNDETETYDLLSLK